MRFSQLTYGKRSTCGGGYGAWSCSRTSWNSNVVTHGCWTRSIDTPMEEHILLDRVSASKTRSIGQRRGIGLLYKDQSASSQIEPPLPSKHVNHQPTVQYFIIEKKLLLKSDRDHVYLWFFPYWIALLDATKFRASNLTEGNDSTLTMSEPNVWTAIAAGISVISQAISIKIKLDWKWSDTAYIPDFVSKNRSAWLSAKIDH